MDKRRSENGRPMEEPKVGSLCSRVVSEGRQYWLRVDDEALVMTHIKGKTKTKAAYIRIPICEILAVEFSNSVKNSVDGKCSSCCRSKSKKRASAETKAASANSTSVRSKPTSGSTEKKSSAVAGSRSPIAAASLARCDCIIVYFINRKADHVWRLGQHEYKFGELSKDGEDTTTAVTASVAAEFLNHLRHRISAYDRPKRLLVCINPFGGKKGAVKVFEKYALPIFETCSIATTVLITQRANHAKDVLLVADLSPFDGIVTVGGDGLFNEILNGLVVRQQRESNVDINDRGSALVRPKIPVGLISAGSTNALAHTIHGTDDVQTCVLHIAIGDKRGVDVCGVYDKERFVRMASTAVSYGFLGDVLKESERLRRLGPPRYILSGAKIWIKNSCYSGMIRYKSRLASSSPDGNTSKLALQPCKSNCNLCKDGEDEIGDGQVRNPRPVSNSTEGEDDKCWTVVDDFTHVVGVVTPCICKLAPKGFGPTCHLGDGYLHLALVSKIGRMKNLAFLAKIMSKSTDHTRVEKFRLFVVKEFSFTPGSLMSPAFTSSSFEIGKASSLDETDVSSPKSPTDRRPSSPASENTAASCEGDLGAWNIDGELVQQPKGTIYFRVHRQLITLFTRGIESAIPSTTPI